MASPRVQTFVVPDVKVASCSSLGYKDYYK
jgi:hypothetical protein